MPDRAAAIDAAGRRGRLLLPLLALLLYLAVGFDQRHYWHEWRYVYSGAHHTVAELAAGRFDPGPPGARPADEVGAWYQGQLFHQAILAAIVKTFGAGQGTIRLMIGLYGAFVPLAALLLAWTLARLGLDPLARPSAALLAVSPLGAWLGFKLMAEGPALALGMAAVALATASLTAGSRTIRMLLALAAGALLALSFVTMDFMPLLFVGFMAALPALGPACPAPVKRIAGTTLVSLAAALLGAWALLGAFGVGLTEHAVMYGYFRAYVKPWEVSVFNVATAGWPFALLLPLAWRSTQRSTFRFLLVWAAVATVPVVIGSSNYVEARYLTAALPACATLAACGFAPVARPALALLIMALSTWATLPFLPYEMSSAELRRLAERTWSERPGAALVLPWNYTDFHFLRVTYPDRPVYLAQSAIDDRGEAVRDAEYEARLARIYPGRYLPDVEALRAVAGDDPVYLGHGRLPPLDNLARLASALRLSPVAERIERMEPMNHLEQSWLWRSTECELAELDREGRYRAFTVRCEPHGRNLPASSSSRTEPTSISSR